MKLNKLIGALCALTVITACTARRTTVEEMVFEPQRIIFETDMGNDVDDALALDMIYKYQDAGLVDLLGVMTNKPGIPSAEYLDIMNTWYGYPEIPIGIVEGGADCENDAVNYANAVCVLQNADGAPVFARTLTDYQSLPSATSLFRQLLALQPDTSVTIISAGFSTNFAALFDSPADSSSVLTGR